MFYKKEGILIKFNVAKMAIGDSPLSNRQKIKSIASVVAK